MDYVRDEQTEETVRELIDSVNAASETAQKYWIILLTLSTYLLVAIAGITHLDLLLDAPTNLPIVSVKVPLAGFFVAAPALLVAVHFTLLLQHEILFNKISLLQTSIDHNSPVWSQLHSYVLSQALSKFRASRPVDFALKGMIVFSILLFPPLLLLYFQITFLPYHAIEITWWHRLCVFFDVSLLLFFATSLWKANDELSVKASPMTRGRAATANNFRGDLKIEFYKSVFSKLLSAKSRISVPRITLFLICVFSLEIATVPDELIDRVGRRIWPVRVPLFEPPGDVLGRFRQRVVFYPTALIFERYRQPSASIGPGLFGWSRNLFISNADLSDRKLSTCNLRYAVFSTSRLPNVDFRFADLSGARFDDSSATMANFTGAYLRAAEFLGSDAAGANFSAAHLERLISIQSHFEGANFSRSEITISEFDHSKFDGANFELARLEGALIYQTNMRGVNFDLACLQGAAFGGFALDRKFGAFGSGSADDSKSNDETPSDFRGSNFRSAVFWQSAIPPSASLQYTNFLHAALKPAGEEQAKSLSALWGELGFVWVPDSVKARLSGISDASSAQWREVGGIYSLAN